MGYYTLTVDVLAEFSEVLGRPIPSLAELHSRRIPAARSAQAASYAMVFFRIAFEMVFFFREYCFGGAMLNQQLTTDKERHRREIASVAAKTGAGNKTNCYQAKRESRNRVFFDEVPVFFFALLWLHTLLLLPSPASAVEQFLDFNDINGIFDLTQPYQDFYADRGLLIECTFDPTGYDPVVDGCVGYIRGRYDGDYSIAPIWKTPEPGYNYLGMTYWKFRFPSGADSASMDIMSSLAEVGCWRKARVDWLDQNGSISSSQISIGSPQETITAPGRVYGADVHPSWGVNKVDDTAFCAQTAFVDNMRFTPVEEPPHPDLEKEKGCQGDNMRGNPCNASTGNKYAREVDYAEPSIGLEFVRSYNSYETQNKSLGVGWVSNLGASLELSADTIVVRGADGRGETWRNVSGAWVGDPDSKIRLTTAPEGFVIEKRNGDVELYSSQGQLLTITSSSGRVTTFAYDANGLLQTVTGPFGHSLTFSHNAQGQLITMTDPGSNIYTYGYDENNNLASVTYPDNTSRQYHYENVLLKHHLTGITNRDDNRYATYVYYSNGALKSSEHASVQEGTTNQKWSFEYDFDAEITTIRLHSRDDGTTPPIFRRLTFETNLGRKRLVKDLLWASQKEEIRAYDGRNNLLSRTDEDGRSTTYTYNSANQPVTITNGAGTPEAKTTSVEYVSLDLDFPLRVTRPSISPGKQNETLFSYDDAYNLIGIAENGYKPDGLPVSRTITFEYNSKGQLTRADGPRTDVNDIMVFARYQCETGGNCGQIAAVTNALGHATSFDSHDEHGRLTQSTDLNGVVSAYSYDSVGRLLSETKNPPAGQGTPRTTSYTYNGEGQVLTSSRPDGVALSYVYNAANQVASVLDNIGNYTTYLYNARGEVNKVDVYDSSDSLTKRTYFYRDHYGRVKTTHMIVDDTLSYDTLLTLRDANGNIVHVEDPNANPATTFEYDALNRLTKVIDALGNVTDAQYDSNDQVVGLAAPNGAATGYSADDFGNVLQEASPDQGVIRYSYDEAGNVVSRTDALGVTSTYSYDALNRLLQTDYPGTNDDFLLVYDECPNGTGRICAISDMSGVASFEYDVFGNVVTHIRVSDGISKTVRYEYDGGDNLIRMTYPNNVIVNYGRDGLRRISSISITENDVTTPVVTGRQYRADGVLVSQTFGNGLLDNRAYDLRGRLTSQSLGNVHSNTFTYDKNSNVLAYNEASFSYDVLNRVNEEAIGRQKTTLEYDANGNRLNHGKDRYTYAQNSNRLTAVARDAIQVNGAGSITAIRNLQLEYDQRQRVSSALNTASAEQTRYIYSATGLRSKSTLADGTERRYYYDLAGRLIAEADEHGDIVATYFWADDMPVAQNAITETTVTTTTGKGKDKVTTTSIVYGSEFVYLHSDHLNSPRLATNSTGAVVWRWDVDAFGSTEASGDPDGDGTAMQVNLRFPGQYYDRETELHYNYHRYYDPQIGRYITADPIGLAGGPNTYAYVGGNPLGWVDKLGLCRVEVRFKVVERFIVAGIPVEPNHGFIVTIDPSGLERIFRAGPKGRFPIFGPIKAASEIYNDESKDWSTQPRPTSVVFDDGKPCTCQNKILDQAASDLNAAQVPYKLFETNSNSAVTFGLDRLGITPPSPPVLAPGWGQPLMP